MPIYKAKITADMTWYFEVEADNEDAAYEELWKEVGYDAEDILDQEPDSEWFDISLKVVK